MWDLAIVGAGLYTDLADLVLNQVSARGDGSNHQPAVEDLPWGHPGWTGHPAADRASSPRELEPL